MYVCLCKAVTDKAIRQQVEGGACSMRELKQQLGVGTQCGKCVCQASDILNSALAKQASSQLIPVVMLNSSRPAA
jgi:bacterioferritin-associated ferredoxin